MQFNSATWMLFLIVFAAGASFGSFINVVIYRLPHKKSVIRPRSFCPSCGYSIPFYLNIPVLSWVMLMGKCRSCSQPISPRYAIVELLSGLILVAYLAVYGPSLHALVASVLTLVLLPIFFIDFEHKIIPDAISLPGIAVGFLLSLLTGYPGWIDSLIGILVGGGSLLLLGYLGDFLFKKESLGGGDIKLAAMLGAFLGWQKILLVFIISAVLGLIGAVLMMALSSKLKENRQIPFGPFLSLAAIIAFIGGDYLISLYIAHILSA